MRPWCGGACLAGRPPIFASSAVHPLLVHAVVHCGPLSTVIWLSHLPALLQCRPVLFLWLVQQRGMDFQYRFKAHLPNGACSQFYHLLKTVFSAWPGSGALLSRDLEGVLYKF